MEVHDVLELVIWAGLTMTRMMARAAQLLLEWTFVAATWVALLFIGVVMAFQRGGLPWVDLSDSRATSRSADTSVHRVPLR